MQPLHHEQPGLWSLILAGHESTHMRSFIEQCMLEFKPKSLCPFVGTRTMLQHTWDRADQLSHPNCKITVVRKPFLHEACTQLGGRVPGVMVTEPQHHGTVASILLALTYLRTQDSDSTLVIYPADHFVYPEHHFLRTIQRAIWAAEELTNQMIVMGIGSGDSKLRSGWIQADRQIGWAYGSPVFSVKTMGFDPCTPICQEDVDPDVFRNTGVIVAKSEVLWKIAWECAPLTMSYFQSLENAIGTSHERTMLDTVFDHLSEHSSLLTTMLQNPQHCAVLGLEDITWSEWESPEQIVESLTAIGKTPMFPVEYSPVPFEGAFSPYPSTREVNRKYAG